MRAGPMKFPRCFEQLKELGDEGMFYLTGDDTDHSSGHVDQELEKLTDGIQQTEPLAAPRV